MPPSSCLMAVMQKNLSMKRLVISVAIACWTLFIVAGCEQQARPPKAVKGVLDLSDWDFARDPQCLLRGDWAFYSKGVTEPEYVYLPGGRGGSSSWNDSSADYRLGVFRLKVIVNRAEQRLGLYAGESLGVYEIRVDRHPILSLENRTAQRTRIYSLSMDGLKDGASGKREIVLAVRAMQYFWHKGTPPLKIVLGEEAALEKNHTISMGFVFLLVGSLITIGVYHLILFILHKKDRTILYLSLFCFLWGIRTPLPFTVTTLTHLFFLICPISTAQKST